MRKCPKCRGKISNLIEVWSGHTIDFEVQDDGEISEEGYMSDGEPSHVEANCGVCSHRWRVRGVHDIDDLREATQQTED
jgi:hypothetical protein